MWKRVVARMTEYRHTSDYEAMMRWIHSATFRIARTHVYSDQIAYAIVSRYCDRLVYPNLQLDPVIRGQSES